MPMNMHLVKFLTTVILALATCATNAQVDGFNKGKGNMDLVLSANYEQGLGYFLADGPIALKRTRISAAFFAAFGITEDLDVQFSLPFINVQNVSGLQDAQLFLKWLPLKAPLGNGKLSFGAALGGSTPVSDYGTEGISAIGQQAKSIIPMGVLQYTAGSGWFTSLVGGQQIVQAPTPDALIGTYRLGHFGAKHFAEAYVQAQRAYGGKDYRGTGDQAPTTFKELGVDLLRVGGKYYKPVGKRVGLVGEVSYVLAGRNVDQALLIAGAFILHFRK